MPWLLVPMLPDALSLRLRDRSNSSTVKQHRARSASVRRIRAQQYARMSPQAKTTQNNNEFRCSGELEGLVTESLPLDAAQRAPPRTVLALQLLCCGLYDRSGAFRYSSRLIYRIART